MKKSLIAILMTAVILLPSMVPLLSTVQAASSDNMTVSGVLKSDTYVLYPFTKENLYLGISKYGELIDGVDMQGLKYGTLDVFANTNVPESDWSQGWYIDIHYADNDNQYQNIWAFAMYTDLSGSAGIGGDWQEACVNGPLGAPHGGRKTNAWATTDPIQVLYDSPRKSIVLTKTTIYAAATKTADDALVAVALTFVFNKDKKDVVVYKDIKRLNPGKWTRTFQVEFSNRGEWDIGTTSAPPSYATFYDNLPTSYSGYGWHDYYSASPYGVTGFDLAQMINQAGTYVGFAAFWPQLFGKLVDGTTHLTRTQVLNSLCTKMYNVTWANLVTSGDSFAFGDQSGWPTADLYPRGAGVWDDEPMVFVNNVLQSGGGADYSWVGATDTITFMATPLDTDRVIVVYKHMVPTGGGADNMASHVPEPDVPYVIGEWCFDLKSADQCRQFRAVTVYGLTNRHNADDVNSAETWSPASADVIDSEVQYYLDETFNPWDLSDAVEKDTNRWVDFYTVTTLDYEAATLGFPLSITLDQIPVLYASNWEQYDSFSEKVMWSGVLKTPQRAVAIPYDYILSVSSTTGTGTVTIPYTKVPAAGTVIKILYSTYTDYTSGSMITEDLTPIVINATGDLADATHTGYPILLDTWTDPTGVGHGIASDEFAFTITNQTDAKTTTDQWFNYTSDHVEWEVTPFKVFKEDTTYLESGAFDFMPVTITNGTSGSLMFNLTEAEFTWAISAPDGTMFTDLRDVYFEYFCADFRVYLNVFYNATSQLYTVYPTVEFGPPLSEDGHGGLDPYTNVYSYWLDGRYEWGVVGRDAASVDSAGLANVAAAFKDKEVEFGLAGADMYDPEIANQMPWVMAPFGTTDTWADYYYSTTDFRTALRDDWCHAGTVLGDEVPVASSNMIGVGGPLANLLSYYGNDFTDAIYGMPAYSGAAYSGMVVPVSCWNRAWNGTFNTYSSSNTVGYAVITTYQDINGTTLFLIWGHWGRDTYYATKWFYDWEIMELQSAPAGITSLIVQIKYESTTEGYKPTAYNIVECLGTISETLWHYDAMYKGGIHDP